MDSDNLLDRWVILLQTQKEAKWGFSSQTHLLQFLLFMETCKGETTDFGSRFHVCIKSYSMTYFLDA